jgi:hypothetical protein
MTRLLRASRGMLVAVAVLALTAGIALAGRTIPSSHQMPDAAAPGLQRAAEAAGKTVPVAAAGHDLNADGTEAAETEAPETEAPETDAPKEAAPVSAPAPPPGTHPDNHGADVSAAAKTQTPAGFDNHGQYVRSIATANHGQTVAADHRNAAANGPHPNH